MKILVDANIGRLIVNFLESLGHDVLRASQLPPRTPDTDVLKIAVEEGRIVMTSDKDFGELAFNPKNSFTTEFRRVSQRKTAKCVEILQEQDYTLQTPTGGFFACKYRRANTLRISAKLCGE